MHELSLAVALLESVDALRKERGAARVVSIRVSIGPLTGVEPELLESAFETIVDDSPARGATLAIERVPLVGRCSACGGEFAVPGLCFQCPRCAADDVAILRGDALVLEEVVLETD